MALVPNYPEFGKASATKPSAFQRRVGNRGSGGCNVRGGNHHPLFTVYLYGVLRTEYEY
jgi:hypothetical protein